MTSPPTFLASDLPSFPGCSFPENLADNGVGRVIEEESPSWPETGGR